MYQNIIDCFRIFRTRYRLRKNIIHRSRSIVSRNRVAHARHKICFFSGTHLVRLHFKTCSRTALLARHYRERLYSNNNNNNNIIAV